ncbi:MAG: pilus assembly protein TadG-related protein [Nocardioides sp.]|uniref:pilus assembly protein TadG-related protein n=1 Tax=Nocardioides sp. TaxID=35761 RepID=UPI0039E5A99A
MSAVSHRRVRDETGQTTIFIVGLAIVLLMTVVMVVDASAAYLRRQGLDNLADGAALAGADAGAAGEEVYTEGVDPERLRQFAARARAGVADYLARSDARGRYPGLTYAVSVDSARRTVTVSVRAPLDLPLTVPGSPAHPVIGAAGSAIVAPDR